jgi:hypothetical protein
MRTNYDLKNIIRESAELQLSVVDSAPYEYTGDDLYDINKRCSDLALQVIANLQVKSKLDKELTFEFILPSGDELISGVMCNLQCTMKQGSCIGAPSYIEIVVQPIKKESITSNGKHIITPSSGFKAMREVEVVVQVYKHNLQGKSITIAENGTQTITADSEFEGLSSVEVTTDINTLQGLDFSSIYDQEQANEINQYYKDGIAYAEKIKAENPNPSGSWVNKFTYSDVIYFPKLNISQVTSLSGAFSYSYNLERMSLVMDTSNVTNMSGTWVYCTKLSFLPELDTSKVTLLSSTWSYCTNIRKIALTSVRNVTNFTNIVYSCFLLEEIRFTEWKQSSISFSTSPKISAESIKYIIWHALNGANTLGFENQGATSRTLQLHVTPYASWGTWKLTKPSVEDCEFLGISEEEITKYGELTWEDIALHVKLITIAK